MAHFGPKWLDLMLGLPKRSAHRRLTRLTNRTWGAQVATGDTWAPFGDLARVAGPVGPPQRDHALRIAVSWGIGSPI